MISERALETLTCHVRGVLRYVPRWSVASPSRGSRSLKSLEGWDRWRTAFLPRLEVNACMVADVSLAQGMGSEVALLAWKWQSIKHQGLLCRTLESGVGVNTYNLIKSMHTGTKSVKQEFSSLWSVGWDEATLYVWHFLISNTCINQLSSIWMIQGFESLNKHLNYLDYWEKTN